MFVVHRWRLKSGIRTDWQEIERIEGLSSIDNELQRPRRSKPSQQTSASSYKRKDRGD